MFKNIFAKHGRSDSLLLDYNVMPLEKVELTYLVDSLVHISIPLPSVIEIFKIFL